MWASFRVFDPWPTVRQINATPWSPYGRAGKGNESLTRVAEEANESPIATAIDNDHPLVARSA